MKSIRGNSWFLVLMLFVFVISCTKVRTDDEYLEYIRDTENGLYHVQELSGYIYSVQMLTEEWYRIRDKKRNRTVEADRYILPDELHFLFSIETQEGINPIKKRFREEGEYFNIVRQLNQQAANLFTLEQTNNEYECVFAQAESSYDLMPSLHITVVFSKVKPRTSFLLEFNDIIWGAGPLRFRFEDQKLNEIPILK